MIGNRYGKYVQKEVQTCFTTSIKQAIEQSNWSDPKKSGEALKDLNILVEVRYPLMNFEEFKGGSKPNFNAQNKQIYSTEYNVEAEPLILMASVGQDSQDKRRVSWDWKVKRKIIWDSLPYRTKQGRRTYLPGRGGLVAHQ